MPTKYELERQIASQAARIEQLETLVRRLETPACPVAGWVAVSMPSAVRDVYLRWLRDSFEPDCGYFDGYGFAVVDSGRRGGELPTPLADGAAVLVRFTLDEANGSFVDDCWLAVPAPGTSQYDRKSYWIPCRV